MATAFVFEATYLDVDDAQLDYTVVKDLYNRGVIDTYDAAVITKDLDVSVHVSKRRGRARSSGRSSACCFPRPSSRWQPPEGSTAACWVTSTVACRAAI